MPTSDAGPSPLTLVYDGDCSICTGAACWLADRAGTGRMSAKPAQDADSLRATGISPVDAAAAAWLVDARGRRYRGAAAINHALAEAGGRWASVARLYEVPAIRTLEDLAYRWFARHHRRWSSPIGKLGGRIRRYWPRGAGA